MNEDRFKVTESAKARIATLLLAETSCEAHFRIEVEGGGCSGFQYKFTISADKPAEDDLIISSDGATIVIDSTSMVYLEGSKLDFVKELGGEYFEVKNPQAASSCGCGNSFSLR